MANTQNYILSEKDCIIITDSSYPHKIIKLYYKLMNRSRYELLRRIMSTLSRYDPEQKRFLRYDMYPYYKRFEINKELKDNNGELVYKQIKGGYMMMDMLRLVREDNITREQINHMSNLYSPYISNVD